MTTRRRVFTSTQGFSHAEMYRYGIDHLRSAELLFTAGPLHDDSAGYLAHLGVELVLKSILLFARGSFPGQREVHNLYRQVESAIPAMRLGKRDRKTIARLDRFYDLRYPNIRTPLDIGSSDWFAIAHVVNSIKRRLPLQFRRDFQALDLLEKGGRRLAYKLIDRKSGEA